jgi:hypothetical protein
LENEDDLYTEIRHLFLNPVEGQKLSDTALRMTEAKSHVIMDILSELYPVFHRANLFGERKP